MSSSDTQFATDVLSTVRYSFGSRDTEAVHWHVRRVHLRETVCEPYTLELELWTEDLEAPLAKLLGDTCTLVIEREGHSRRVHGIVHHVDMLPAVVDRLRVRVRVAPALHLLGFQRNTRFWQDRTTLEILDEVLGPALSTYGREFELKVDPKLYFKREYCVQYRETDLEFATRLMLEEGIVYAFEHEDGDVERLVLHDTTSLTADLGIPTVPYVPPGSGAASEQSVGAFDWSYRLGTTTVVQRDWTWKEDAPISYNHERRTTDVRQYDRERYDHDDRRLNADDGAPRARDKQERERQFDESGRGTSDVLEMVPGRCFELQFHPVFERDGRYLLISVTHVGDAPEVGQQHSDPDAAGPRYSNEFVCIRPEVPYRGPPPPPRQRVHGPHTAVVVGPDSEEIHTDEHGRIRVIFHWDRLSPHDETASCWIRVAQTWAGLGWGHQFIPRIGMEVLVEFIDGDPDRPVVTGCVYNGLNRPPYTLPDKKTQSGIKTDSSPGGGGSNELRFEDAKGHEEVWIHAQKDFNEKVENCHSTTVGADQSNSVGGNQTNTVQKDQTETIVGQQTMTVEKNRTVTIHGSQDVTILGESPAGGNSGSKLGITGTYKVDATVQIDMQAPTHIKLTCGASSITIDPKAITLQAGDGAKLVLDANALLQAKALGKLLLDANALIEGSGHGKGFFDANALIHGNGGAQVLFDANANMTSNAGSQVLLNGDAKVLGVGTATITSPNTTLAGGSDTVVAGGGKVNVTGGTINLNS